MINEYHFNLLKYNPPLKLPNNVEIFNGWFSLLYSCLYEIRSLCIKKKYELPDVLYVKQKFAKLAIGLDFKQNLGRDEILNIVKKYSEISLSVCEVTGNSGKLRIINDYYIIVCDEVFNKLNNKKIKNNNIYDIISNMYKVKMFSEL